MAKKIDSTEEKIHAVEEALSKTEHFIEVHQKTILIVIGAIILTGLAIFGVNRLILAPRENNAQAQMYMAQRYFEQDSLDKALNGDANYDGFLGIIDNYSFTKASRLAKYYAGIIYLKQGKYEDAITYLKKFKSDDEFIGPMAKGGIGDAYLELGDKESALRYYEKAASMKDNDITTPIYSLRAAMLYEEMGRYDKAIALYEKIKTEHPRSNEARGIEKYIERARELSGK